MTGRAEVERLKKILDSTFERAAGVQEAELLSDFARYLCVLVSGFLEQAVIELVLEYVRNHSNVSTQRHLESRLRQLTNVKSRRLIDLLGSFDPEWRKDMEAYLVDDLKAAVDSIVDLRNTVSHGRFAELTMPRVQDYYRRIKQVVDHVADLSTP